MRKFMVSLMASAFLMAGMDVMAAGDQDLFLSKCGSCHKKDGSAAVINPGEKAGAVWKKYFERSRHPVDISNISPQDMAKIVDFLVSHAADSEQPAAAIIPK
ncbi:MAG: hypothetical protein ABWK15_02360 [Dissulfuribacterales bacterium]